MKDGADVIRKTNQLIDTMLFEKNYTLIFPLLTSGYSPQSFIIVTNLFVFGFIPSD